VNELLKLVRNFIYRDLAFIVGGTIVLASLAYALGRTAAFTRADVPLHFIVLFLALAYVLGYATQDFGGLIFRLVRTGALYERQPSRCWQQLYKRFTDSEWKEVNYTEGNPTRFEVDMAGRAVPPPVQQSLDRIVSLKVISLCIGACSLLSSLIIAVIDSVCRLQSCFQGRCYLHWSGAAKHPFAEAISLGSFLLVLGLVLVCLGRIKLMQEMQFLQAMKNQNYPLLKTPSSEDKTRDGE
jgi:hypothetical protein